MDSSYRPQSPDLSSYAPQDLSSYAPRSPDLSGLRPQSPDLSGPLPSPSPRYGHHHTLSRDRFGNNFPNNFTHQGSPTSVPSQPLQPSHYTGHSPFDMAPTTRRMRAAAAVDDEYLPDAHSYPVKQEAQPTQPSSFANGSQRFDFDEKPAQLMPAPLLYEQRPADPTCGVQLKTSFPVARIKRLMQADDDIGKVAQVTPHVVSRALELFMIRIISASAAQAAQSGGGSGKGPKRILAQHVKRVLQADDNFDFLVDIIAKVPDAPAAKPKKEQAGSDSDEGPGSAKMVPKRRGKKRKEAGDD